jgi:hypothetical protein
MGNPYLQKLHSLDHQQGAEFSKIGDPSQLTKPTEPPFVSFVGDQGLGVFEKLRDSSTTNPCINSMAKTSEKVSDGDRQNRQNPVSARVEIVVLPQAARYRKVFTHLQLKPPALVPVQRWQQAVEDGKRFLAKWGEQAQALGWSSADLFGLHEIPTKPHPSYSRLSRYDCTGLIWLLEGRPVVALTETTATIRNSKTGNVTVYRRFDKPGARAGRRFAGRSRKHRRARP